MPTYVFKHEDEYIEEMYPMSEIPSEIERDGKVFTYVPTFGSNFILKGRGWASKGTATAPKPTLGKEVGVAVDNEKREAMKAAGEKV